MLILTRNMGSTLNIGDDITITVLEVKGNQVRIGIDAPIDIQILRSEAHVRIKKEIKSEEV